MQSVDDAVTAAAERAVRVDAVLVTPAILCLTLVNICQITDTCQHLQITDTRQHLQITCSIEAK